MSNTAKNRPKVHDNSIRSVCWISLRVCSWQTITAAGRAEGRCEKNLWPPRWDIFAIRISLLVKAGNERRAGTRQWLNLLIPAKRDLIFFPSAPFPAVARRCEIPMDLISPTTFWRIKARMIRFKCQNLISRDPNRLSFPFLYEFLLLPSRSCPGRVPSFPWGFPPTIPRPSAWPLRWPRPPEWSARRTIRPRSQTQQGPQLEWEKIFVIECLLKGENWISLPLIIPLPYHILSFRFFLSLHPLKRFSYQTAVCICSFIVLTLRQMHFVQKKLLRTFKGGCYSLKSKLTFVHS